MLTGDILDRAADRLPNKLALIDARSRLTYREWSQVAQRFAAALQRSAPTDGATVAILAGNCAEYAVAYFGAARTGAISVHLPTRASDRDLQGIMALSAPQMLITQASLLPRARALLAATGAQIPLVVIEDAEIALGAGEQTFADFLAAGHDGLVVPAPSAEAPLALTFTSGTTGFPKAIAGTHRQRFFSATAAALEFGATEFDVVGLTTPLSTAAGQGARLTAAVLAGSSIVMMGAWNAEAFVETVWREQVDVTFLVPAQVGDVLPLAQAAPARLASLKAVHYGSAPMAPSLLARAVKLLPHVELIESYGQSETGPLTVKRGRHAERGGSVGRSMFMVELALFDEDGARCPPGVPGEIVTRGPHVMSGYHGAPEATAHVFRHGGGWLATGDIGAFDRDGFLTLLGRKDDRINSGGEKYFCQEVEAALMDHAAVADCAVAAAPDDRLGEVAAALVVLEPGQTATTEDLVETCIRTLARHKRPRRIIVVDKIPRNHGGKVIRRDVLAHFLSEREAA